MTRWALSRASNPKVLRLHTSAELTLETIETWLSDFLPERTTATGSVRADVYGVTVHSRDLEQVTQSDRARVNGLVLSGIFLILILP